MSDNGSDGETTIPASVMAQVDHIRLDNQIISLEEGPPGDFKPKLNEDVAKRLSQGTNETSPCTTVALLGNTGAGKSFLLQRLLERFGVAERPFAIDYGDSDGGYCPVSVTGNIHCFTNGNQLFFDVEGTGGTIPLLERIRLGIGNRLNITAGEQRMQDGRKASVAKYFPQLAYVISTSVVYVTREPLNCTSTNEAILRFTTAAGENADGVRPHLIILHNLCPLAHACVGEAAERKFTQEYLATWDADMSLRSMFAGVSCMTFPDVDAFDKKRELDGEELFERQLQRLVDMLQRQCAEQALLREHKFCALTPRALFRVLPPLMQQLQDGGPVSIPRILSENMKNNPDSDCRILSGVFKSILQAFNGVLGPELTEDKVKLQVTGLALSMCISARYLAFKFRLQDTVSFPNEWIAEQAGHLFERLKHYVLSVFLVCCAEYTEMHDSSGVPQTVRCKRQYIGHDGHITECKVCPTDPQKTSWFMRAFRKIFGGFHDRWPGDFKVPPAFEAALCQTLKPLIVKEALQAAGQLRLKEALPYGSTSGSAATSVAEPVLVDAFGSFCQSGRECMKRYQAQLGGGIRPQVCRSAPVGGSNSEFPFCVVCFKLVDAREPGFLLCAECHQTKIAGAIFDDMACGVCMDSKKEFVCVPCGHYGLCTRCKDGCTACPWCRTQVQCFMRIYNA